MTLNLETVTNHYLIALLWSETDADGTPLDSTGYGLSQAAINTAEGDCESFLEIARAEIAKLPEWYGEEQFGHDFLLTRNGHGVGFWDRGLGDIGRELTQHAESYGNIHAFVDSAGTISTE